MDPGDNPQGQTGARGMRILRISQFSARVLPECSKIVFVYNLFTEQTDPDACQGPSTRGYWACDYGATPRVMGSDS